MVSDGFTPISRKGTPIVVALGGAKKKKEFKEARGYFHRLKKAKRYVKMIWVEGTRIQKLFGKLRDRKIKVGVPGKGQSVWISMGYLFAKEANALVYDRHMEEQTVSYFREFIGTAWEHARGEKGGTQIPSWNRVVYSVPEIYEELIRAVEEDNE